MNNAERYEYNKNWDKKRKRICCVYKIQSIRFPDLIYIGQSKDFYKRRVQHITRTGNKILRAHINKYGIEDLRFYIIETCNDYELMEREQFYISEYNPYFNTFRFSSFNDLSCNLAHEIAKRDIIKEYTDCGMLQWLHIGDNIIVQSFEDQLNIEIIPYII